jgi:methionyl-tRNA formyltransferase
MPETRIPSGPRKRIAIFAGNDKTWALPVWEKTIPLLQEQFDVVGLYLFPDRLGKYEGMAAKLWYLRVFGIWNAVLFTFFSFKRAVARIFSKCASWYALARRFQIELCKGKSPNDPEVVQWTRDRQIDIIFIMVGTILRKEILNAPKIGVINKHAALLPSCKGLLPYFWAKLTDQPTGITFYQVDEKIDTGKALIQLRYPNPDRTLSLLGFYIEVFHMYPKLALEAARRLTEGKCLQSDGDIESSYHGLPNRGDYKKFKSQGYQAVSITDLFYQPKSQINTKELK